MDRKFLSAAIKSFTAQLCILYQLAFALDHRLEEGQSKIREISLVVESDLRRYAESLPALAYKLKDKTNFYYLARGVNFAVADEGALKLKEIAYVHAEGMPSGELKHGTLALISDGTPVFAICPWITLTKTRWPISWKQKHAERMLSASPIQIP